MDSTRSILISAFTAVALLGFCASAQAQSQTYQWVDKDGNVVYGDSPQWADAREVGALDTNASPQAPVSSTSAAPLERSSPDADEQALAEALAKLNSVMDEVATLNKQVNELEQAREELQANVAAASASDGPESSTLVRTQMMIDAPTLMEVAVVEPQPIESRMSEKDRARSRWESENAAQKRFLDRIANMGRAKQP